MHVGLIPILVEILVKDVDSLSIHSVCKLKKKKKESLDLNGF